MTSAADEIADLPAPVEQIGFTGGEPFLYPEFVIALTRRAAQLGFKTVCVERERPGGISSSTLTSRSPYTVIAAVRGIGVAVITSTSGAAP